MAYFNGKRVLFSPKMHISDGYEKGLEDGYNNGYEEGYSNGRDDGEEARDYEWWMNYQVGDGVDNFAQYMFSGKGWNKETFKPLFTVGNKRDCNSIFYYHNLAHPVYDMAEHLEALGVDMDFSMATNLAFAFFSARVSRIGVVDVRAISASYNSREMFNSTYIQTIDEIIFCEKAFDWHTNMFYGATALSNLTVSGVIANTINFQWCPLTPASMKSIISVLKNFAGTDKEYVNSITFNDDCWAALEADSVSPSGGTWSDYVSDLGWNT